MYIAQSTLLALIVQVGWVHSSPIASPTNAASPPLGKPISTTITGSVIAVTSHPPATTSLLHWPISPTALTSTSKGDQPACQKIQHQFSGATGGNEARANAVKAMYIDAWEGYEKYAYGYDQLLPLSAAGTNNFYGWGLSIVEALDTAIVMNLSDIAAKQLAHIATVDFASPAGGGPVDTFDSNIRLIGGMLSAYDLLNSGLFPNHYNQTLVEALLKQAVVLADKVAYSFDTPVGLSSGNADFGDDTAVFGTATINGVTYNISDTASTGTFILEWGRLSDLTGNDTYRELSQRANDVLINPSPAPVFPGLVGTTFNGETGEMLTFDGGWHSEVDSFLEYLIKTYQYKATNATIAYKDFWVEAVNSTIQHLALHPYGFEDAEWIFLSELNTNGSITYSEDDFTCFAGGNFLLGGTLLGNQQIVDLGLAVTAGCIQTYDTSVTGLGPISWAWYDSADQQIDLQDDNDSAEHRAANMTGFYIPSGDENWEFRPESIESTFYAYRITGNSTWADHQWNVFKAIEATARNNIAYATVNNVKMQFGGAMSDEMDS